MQIGPVGKNGEEGRVRNSAASSLPGKGPSVWNVRAGEIKETLVAVKGKCEIQDTAFIDTGLQVPGSRGTEVAPHESQKKSTQSQRESRYVGLSQEMENAFRLADGGEGRLGRAQGRKGLAEEDRD